jgi:hypothetical protein
MQMSCKYRQFLINATMLQKTIVLFCLALLWGSCNRDTDEENPSITTFTVNGVDTLATAAAGSTVTVEVGFLDNDALQQYRLTVSDYFSSLNISGASSTYSYTDVVNISGTAINETVQLAVPSTANSGPYWVALTVIDAAGNDADELYIDLTLTNASQSVVNLNSYSTPVNINDTVWFAGTVTDDDLDQINLQITDAANVSYYNHTFDYADSTVTSWDFNTMTADAVWAIPNSTYVAGTYQITITVLDNDGNFTIREENLIVN